MNLIMRAGQGRAIWNRLVEAGAVAIGLRERHYLRTRRGIMTFPQDYPESEAGRHFSSLEAKRLRDIMLRKPKGKRVNYLVNSAPCPYEMDWSFFFENEEEEERDETFMSPFCVPRDSTFAQLVRHSEDIPESSFPTMIPVLIVMIRGGKIERGTMLFRYSQHETKDLRDKTLKPEKPNLSTLSTLSHELLGFVTSSHDAFKSDACGGIALCDVKIFWKSIQDDFISKGGMGDAPTREGFEAVSLILTRNKSSLHFGLAWMYVRRAAT